MDNKDMDKKKKEMQDMERDERYVRRRQLKEAEEEEEISASKKPRLDLLDKLKTTSSVIDILAASGSEPRVLDAFELLSKDASASKKPKLDLLDKLKPTASVFDILAASGSEPLHTLPEDHEVCSNLFSLAVVQTLTSHQRWRWRLCPPPCLRTRSSTRRPTLVTSLLASSTSLSPCPRKSLLLRTWMWWRLATIYLFSLAVPPQSFVDISSKVAMEIFGEIFEAATGAEEASSIGFPIGDESFQADSQVPLGAMDCTSNTR